MDTLCHGYNVTQSENWACPCLWLARIEHANTIWHVVSFIFFSMKPRKVYCILDQDSKKLCVWNQRLIVHQKIVLFNWAPSRYFTNMNFIIFCLQSVVSNTSPCFGSMACIVWYPSSDTFRALLLVMI